jgi:hypothetical protein
MLNALLRGKRRGTGVDGGSFDALEDTATATLFERLSYLPDDVLIQILFARDIWGSDVLKPEKVEALSFWPRWSLPESDGENGTVEPDVAIEFDDRLLVIEAKRFDNVAMQRSDQLAREWRAARRENPRKPVWLLAVAGLRDSCSRTLDTMRQQVLTDLVRAAGEDAGCELRLGHVPWYGLFGLIEGALAALPQHRRLLRDMREGLALHGVRVARPVWFAELLEPAWGCLCPITATAADFPRLHMPLPPLDSSGGITTDPSNFSLDAVMTQDLTSAFTDVRRAYRLLWGYQKRVLHCIAFIRDRLGYTRHCCVDYQFNKPSDDIEDRWTWDALPFTLIGFEAVKRAPLRAEETPTAANRRVRMGDRFLYLYVVSDTGLDDMLYAENWEREPDPSRFAPPEASRSELRLHILESRRDQEPTIGWDKGIVQKIECWPEHGKCLDDEVLGVCMYSETFNFAEIADQDALSARVDVFQKAAESALAGTPVAAL